MSTGEQRDAEGACSAAAFLAEPEEALQSAAPTGSVVTAPSDGSLTDVEPAATSSGDLLPAIARLKAQQNALRAEKQKVSKELRNAEKRRQRLKRKAKQLTDCDLLQVMQLRAAGKAGAAAQPDATRASKPKAPGSMPGSSSDKPKPAKKKEGRTD